MSAAALSSYIPIYNRLNTWSPVALILTDIVCRWQMTQAIPHMRNPEELRAERYQELSQGFIFLGLTMQALYQKSGLTLACITVVALGRLYSTLKIVPWVKSLAHESGATKWEMPKKTYYDVMYKVIEVVVSINATCHAIALNRHHPLWGLAMAAAALILPTLISTVFHKVVKAGYWDLQDGRLISLKLERMQFGMLSLQLIRAACVYGLLGEAFKSVQFIPPKTIKIDVYSRFLLYSIFLLGGGCFGYFLAARHFYLENWLSASVIADRATSSTHNTEHRLFVEMAYSTGVSNIAHYCETQLIKAFNSNNLNRQQMQSLFSYWCLICNTPRLVNILKGCPNCFTPEFLATEPNLWKNLDNDQIQTYLLPPEIHQLLKDDKVAKTEEALKELTEEIAAMEQSAVKEFKALRPLRERLEDFSFAQADDFLRHVPKSDRSIVVQLTQLKAKIAQREAQVAALEQRLETFCEDVKHAYESIPHLREEDMKKVLEQTGVSAEGQYSKTLFTLLATFGIKWRGDLVAHKILQDGDNANSTDNLINRLVKFIQVRNEALLSSILKSSHAAQINQ
jgi:uncharacterized coiled-coil protein SlyX